MTALNFPTGPTNGQTYTSGTITWTWDATGGSWIANTMSIGPTGPAGVTGVFVIRPPGYFVLMFYL